MLIHTKLIPAELQEHIIDYIPKNCNGYKYTQVLFDKMLDTAEKTVFEKMPNLIGIGIGKDMYHNNINFVCIEK